MADGGYAGGPTLGGTDQLRLARLPRRRGGGGAHRKTPGAGREALRRLRAVLRRSATALMAGKAPGRRNLEAINTHLAAAPVRRRVVPAGDRPAGGPRPPGG